jgi:hypothetical protein
MITLRLCSSDLDHRISGKIMLKTLPIAECQLIPHVLIYAFLVCRQKYQELYRLESRKDKRKLKKRQKLRRKSRSGPDSAKKPKKIYTTEPHYHRQHSSTSATTMPSHRFSIPSIRVEAPPAAAAATKATDTKTTPDKSPHRDSKYLSHHHRRENDDEGSDDESGDSNDEHVEKKKTTTKTKTIDSKSSHFQETFARFRQSYLSTRPKVSSFCYRYLLQKRLKRK